MTFLNPLVLLGLLAAGIPILIHLFNFRKPKKIDFSSLAFLQELEKTAMQRVKIEQWLLLALRILTIIFLVLGFAQPLLKGAATDARHARTRYSFVVDNSLSMKLRNTQGEYFQQAQRVMQEVVGQTKKGDEFQLFTTANTGLPVNTVYKNGSPLLDELRKIRPETSANSLLKTVKQALRQMNDVTNRNKEVFVFSDLQRATFLDSLEAIKPKNVHLVLVPIGSDAPANVAVTDIQVETRIIEQGQPVTMNATLTNFSDKRLENFAVNVVLEGQPVAQTVANVEPKGKATVSFTVTPHQRGWLGGWVKIEGDTFEDDNTRYFSLLVPERRSVLLVRGDGERTNYVDLALSPQINEGNLVFQTQGIPEGSFGGTQLENYNALILIGKKRFASGEIANLKRYLENGGGVLMFAGSNAVQADYNALFAALGAGKMNGYLGQPGGASLARFDRLEAEHPLFEGVFARGELASGKTVESVEVRYALNYGEGTGNEQTLIRLTNNSAFLHEIKLGKGAMLLVTVAPDPQWSDLPSRGLFIPLLYRAMYYLSATQTAGENALQTEDVLITGVSGSEPIKLVSAKGESYTPPQQAAYNGVMIQVDDAIQQSGIYDVMQGTQVLRKIAVNADSRESDLTRMTPDEAQKQLSQAVQTDVRLMDVGRGTQRQIKDAIGTARFGDDLWNVFLLLALITLITEMLVSIRRKTQVATP